MKEGSIVNRPDYIRFLNEMKERIQSARSKAILAANKELISLYWEIGRSIVEKQNEMGWGRSVVEQLARDLRREFPDAKGFSARNLWRMRAFYIAYSELELKLPQSVAEIEGINLPQGVAEIPWGHNVVLLEKVKNSKERLWYAEQAASNGWSRNILIHQIETKLYERQAERLKTTNFPETLPLPQSELVEQVIKDPYVFDFINLGEEAKERELERALLDRIRDFLLELGTGFAFMGSQYHLEVAHQDYYIDLLFYHHRLRCLVAIDLKMGEFIPEYAGKMNFYLSALDDMVKHPDDEPSVGLILCKSKNGVIAEYSLRNMNRPIGVSEYRLTQELPGNLREELPSREELAEILEGGGTGAGAGNEGD